MSSLEGISGFLGASWKTTVLGYLEAILWYVGMFIHDGTPIPTTKEGWGLLIVGAIRAIYGRLTKDANVTGGAIKVDVPVVTVIK